MIFIWSFEVTVVGSVQVPDEAGPASSSPRIFFWNLWEKEFSFPQGIAYLVKYKFKVTSGWVRMSPTQQ